MNLQEIDLKLDALQSQLGELRVARKQALGEAAEKQADVVGKSISSLMALFANKGAFFQRFNALKDALETLRGYDPNCSQRFSDPFQQGLVDSGLQPDADQWKFLVWLSKKGSMGAGGDS